MHLEREQQRLTALAKYQILDTPPEESFDELTELTARTFNCAVSYIKFIDETRAWFKSKVGLPPELTELPREETICNFTITQSDLVVVRDLSQDERFSDNPNVSGPPNLRFYCGMPLIDPDGYALGTFCVVDFAPKDINFEQREFLRTLSHQVVSQLQLRRVTSELIDSIHGLEVAKSELQEQNSKVDSLLCNIFPRQVAAELKENGRVKARYYNSATVGFSDFEKFTQHVTKMQPAELVETLDRFFSVFDDIMDSYGLEKIKTIGDCYMFAAGIPVERRDNSVQACLAALQIHYSNAKLNDDRIRMRSEPWRLRTGLHAGPVMTGVVGRRKFTYDVWGDTVNLAQRVQVASAPGTITVTESVFRRVAHLFNFEDERTMRFGDREFKVYRLTEIRPELAADTVGACPNDAFQRERHRLPSDDELNRTLSRADH